MVIVCKRWINMVILGLMVYNHLLSMLIITMLATNDYNHVHTLAIMVSCYQHANMMIVFMINIH